MVRRKSVRTRGKLQLSKYFQEFENGDSVIVVIEDSVQNNLPKRMQGRTGVVGAKRGRAYIINVKDHDKMKKFLVEPIHLKKMNLN